MEVESSNVHPQRKGNLIKPHGSTTAQARSYLLRVACHPVHQRPQLLGAVGRRLPPQLRFHLHVRHQVAVPAEGERAVLALVMPLVMQTCAFSCLVRQQAAVPRKQKASRHSPLTVGWER